jgi:hypothetical protein
MLAGSALITATSLAYFDFEVLPPFVIEKLPLEFERFWLLSLRVHVASALLALPSCLLLTTRALQRRPAWHRPLGRISAAIVLFGVVPSGVVLAFDAKGGSVVTAGFLLSAAIVAAGIARGVAAARRRDLGAHARALRHVVAQMSVAVSSRVLIVVFDLAGVDPEHAYVAALWGPVLASAALAELVSRSSIRSRPLPFRSLERIRREISALAVVLRIRSLVRPIARLGR